MKDQKDKSIMGAAGTAVPGGLILGGVIGYLIKGEKGAMYGAVIGAVGLTYIVWSKKNK